MSNDTDPKQVLQRYLDALLAGDVEAIRESFAADATWTVMADLPIAGPWHGRERIVDDFLVAAMADRFAPGSQVFTFPTMIADGETVALEWHLSARTAAGDPYENDYCGVFVIRDGRIGAVREYLDSGYASRVLLAELE